jgi:hypothetical protein
MKRLLRSSATPLHILVGCWLVFLLAACGSATTTGSGNSVPTPTKVPTLTATKVPTLTPTLTPTLVPTPAKLVLTFECKGDFNPSGTNEKVCVRTLPGASLTIKVTYCTGSVDQSNALSGTFTADKTGYYGWSWTPKATCQGNPSGATGFWKGTADVTATLGMQHLTGSVSFGA